MQSLRYGLIVSILWTQIGMACADETTPAALVQAVRENEAWLDAVASLYLEVEIAWTKTARGLAVRKDLLQQQCPDRPLTPEHFSDLRPISQGELVCAFDRSRMRFHTRQAGHWDELHIWDGTCMTSLEQDDAGQSVRCTLQDDFNAAFEQCMAAMSWPRARPHSLWWSAVDIGKDLPTFGLAEEFSCLGTETCRGAECTVLEVRPKDIRGIMAGQGPGRYIGGDYQQAGFIGEVRGITDQAFRWYVGAADQLLYGVTWYSDGVPFIEYWMADYQEISPGCRLPMTQGYTIYEQDEQTREAYADSACALTVTRIQVNEPLPDSLFIPDIPEDAQVIDRTRRGRRAADHDAAYVQLTGKPLPMLGSGELDPVITAEADRPMLICFLDVQQRPSRHCLPLLTGIKKDLDIHIVQVGPHETLENPDPDFRISVLSHDTADIRQAWGIKALPWLILTDAGHTVVAEGFSPEALSAMISEAQNAERRVQNAGGGISDKR